MPSSLVEVRRSYTETEEVAIMDAVHESLVAAFTIPAADKHVRFLSYEPHRFRHSPGRAQPDRVTSVCWGGTRGR
jgi:hypothetical protein